MRAIRSIPVTGMVRYLLLVLPEAVKAARHPGKGRKTSCTPVNSSQPHSPQQFAQHDSAAILHQYPSIPTPKTSLQRLYEPFRESPVSVAVPSKAPARTAGNRTESTHTAVRSLVVNHLIQIAKYRLAPEMSTPPSLPVQLSPGKTAICAGDSHNRAPK
jgi:hypothetical protein